MGNRNSVVNEINDLIVFIRNYVNERSPWLLTTLNIKAKIKYKQDFVKLFLNDTSAAVSILRDLYSDESSVIFIVEIFAKAISIKLGIVTDYGKLVKLILEKPEEFLGTVYRKIAST